MEEASEMENLPVISTLLVVGCRKSPLATPFAPRETAADQEPPL